MMQKIFDQSGNLIAIFLPFEKAMRENGIAFFTEDSDSLQLGNMRHEAGYKIASHVHNKKPRTIETTKETLFIRSGEVRMDLFGLDSQYLVSVTLTAGDVVLLVSGGHGFTFVQDSEIVEVKQGPYMGADDKFFIDEVETKVIKY